MSIHHTTRRLARALPRLASVAVLLLFLAGCDERTPLSPRPVAGGLDLSDLEEGSDGWTIRRVDRERVGLPDTVRAGDSLWLVVRSSNGEAGRWRRKVRWPADEFPVLSWRWRVSRRVDSLRFSRRTSPAACMAVDVTLASAFGFHKTIRYIWSARSDRGREYQGDGWHPKVVVLRDARDSISVRSEQVDVWSDFQRLWGFTPRHQALSIGIAVHDPDPERTLSGRFGPIIAGPGKETPP